MFTFPRSWSLFLLTFILGVFCSGSSASPLLLVPLPRADADDTDANANAEAAKPNPWPIVIGVLATALVLLVLGLLYLWYSRRKDMKDLEHGRKRPITFDSKKMGGNDLNESLPSGWVKGFQLVLPRSNSTKSNGTVNSDDTWDSGYRQSAIFHDVNLGAEKEKSEVQPYVPNLAKPRRAATKHVLPPIRRHESLLSVLSVHGTPSLMNRSEMDLAYAELLQELHEEGGSNPASPPGLPVTARAARRRSNSTPPFHQHVASNSTSSTNSSNSSNYSKSTARSASTTRQMPKSASHTHTRHPSGPRFDTAGVRGRTLTPSDRQAQPIRNLPSLASRGVLYVTNTTPQDRYSVDTIDSYATGETASNGERVHLGRPHTTRSAGVTSRGFKTTAPLQGNYI